MSSALSCHLVSISTEAESNTISIRNRIHRPILPGIINPRASRARRRTIRLQPHAIPKRIPIRTERISINLTSIKIHQPPRIRILQLQNRLLHFSRRSPYFDRDAVILGRADGSAPNGIGSDGDFGTAALLIAGVEVDGERAVVGDVGVSERGVCGDVGGYGGGGAEGGDGGGGGYGDGAGGEGDGDLRGYFGGGGGGEEGGGEEGEGGEGDGGIHVGGVVW